MVSTVACLNTTGRPGDAGGAEDEVSSGFVIYGSFTVPR
jgi:hypothetical protein